MGPVLEAIANELRVGSSGSVILIWVSIIVDEETVNENWPPVRPIKEKSSIIGKRRYLNVWKLGPFSTVGHSFLGLLK